MMNETQTVSYSENWEDLTWIYNTIREENPNSLIYYTPPEICDVLLDTLEDWNPNIFKGSERILVHLHPMLLWRVCERVPFEHRNKIFFLLDTQCSDNISDNYYLEVAALEYIDESNIIKMDLSTATTQELEIMNNFNFVGNPPYQHAGKNSKQRTSKLYMNIIDKLIQNMGDGKFMAMVTPPTLFNISKIYGMLESTNLLDVTRGQEKYFDSVSTKISTWVLEKAPYNGSTMVDGKEYNLNNCFLSEDADIELSVIVKCFGSEPKIGLSPRYSIKKQDFKTESDDVYKYEYFINNTSSVYGKLKENCYADKKIIMSRNRKQFKPIYNDGTLGIHEQSMYIMVTSKAQGERVLNILNSTLYQYLIKACITAGFFSTKGLQNLPYVDFNHNWTDAELYAHFKLTLAEIKQIESVVK